MGAPLHVWAAWAALLLVIAGGGLAAAIGTAALEREPYHGRHAPGARAIGRARVARDIELTLHARIPRSLIGARMHTFAMTPGVVHLATCMSLRGRVAPPWPWADGKTYVQIKAEMKRNHTTACARCKPVGAR